MAYVYLAADDVPILEAALPQVTVSAPSYLFTSPDGTTTLSYISYQPVPRVAIVGTGFTFDAQGILTGGTITEVRNAAPPVGNGIGANQGTGYAASVGGLSLDAAVLLQLLRARQPVLPTLLAGSNTYDTRTGTITGSANDDVFNILGPTTAIPYNFFPNTQPAKDYSQVSVSGGGGRNTAVFAPLRAEATITGGGGNEKVAAPTIGINATLLAIDQVRFLDGATYETNASPGAQAALEFVGIFGRLPDAINAGGFALVATQSDTVAAASLMLATPEAAANTAGLDNAAFVTRLYRNMLQRAPDDAGFAGWKAALDAGQLARSDVVARFAASDEAQAVNAPAFAAGSVFAADTNAVEVLRAYETLLGRTPDKGALVNRTAALNAGGTLPDLYGAVQHSSEFAARTSNPYGITATTSYAAIYATAHTDPLNTVVGALVTANGVAYQ